MKKFLKHLGYVVAFGVTAAMIWHRFLHSDVPEVRWLIEFWHIWLGWFFGIIFGSGLYLYGSAGNPPKTVFLLTSGDGSDGDEWNLISIHSSFELAAIAKKKYEEPKTRVDGSIFAWEAQIEEWTIDK